MPRSKRNFRAALAALGEVRVPEEASGDGAVRAPGLAEFFKALGGRTIA
jgi:hypothetical protein